MITERLALVSLHACRLGFAAMALRSFVASDGREWTVWLVRPASASPLLARPGEWLAFQNEEGTERRRLSEVPARWEELSDERLDLLRRVAEVVGVSRGDHSLSTSDVHALTVQLIDALRAAHGAGRGLPAGLEPLVRAYARAQREAGAVIGAVLVDVKALVRDNTGRDEPIFTPKVVGWTVAGFFEGTGSK
jgi:hypothetical protein